MVTDYVNKGRMHNFFFSFFHERFICKITQNTGLFEFTNFFSVDPKYTEFKLIYLRRDFPTAALFLRIGPSTWGFQIRPRVLFVETDIARFHGGGRGKEKMNFLQVWQLLCTERIHRKLLLRSTERCVN